MSYLLDKNPTAEPEHGGRRLARCAGLGGALAVAALAFAVGACAWSGVPDHELSWYGKDGTRVLLVVDESQDSINYSAPQLEGLIYALATYAAQSQGSLSVAGLRNNTISALRFSDPVPFSTRKHSDVQRRRDLTVQRNAVDLARLARVIRAARQGPQRTDLLEGMVQIEGSLAGSNPDGRPVLVVVVTNGLVATPSFNFRDAVAGVKAVLERARAEGLVAQLPGVRLVLVGVGRASSGVDPAKYRWLHAFWRSYALAAGATPYFVRSIGDVSLLVEDGRR
jgi:hypothetical protein